MLLFIFWITTEYAPDRQIGSLQKAQTLHAEICASVLVTDSILLVCCLALISGYLSLSLS